MSTPSLCLCAHHEASAALAVQVAVLSAQKHAPDLLPVLLYPSTRPSRLTEWFEAQGGLVFRHRSVLLPRWKVRAALSHRKGRPGTDHRMLSGPVPCAHEGNLSGKILKVQRVV